MISDSTLVCEESSADWVRFDQIFCSTDHANGTSIEERSIKLIKFHCPHCQQKVSADPGRVNESIKCPSCGADFVAPSSSPEGQAPTISTTQPGEIASAVKNPISDTPDKDLVVNKSEKQYHVLRSGEQTGPHTLEEITAKLAAGELSSNDLCWTEGMAEWAPIREVLTIGSATPPPQPKRSVSNSTVQAAGVATQATQAALATEPNRWPINWIPTLVCFCLMAAFMVCVDLAMLDDNEDEAGMILLVGLPVMILAAVFWSLLHYKCWNSLPAAFRATTPGKAVGFMFIPLFNFYWAFSSWPKLSEGLVNWQTRSGIAPKSTKGLAIAFAILFVCHLVFEILSITALGLMVKIALLVIFILYYRTLVRGFNQMLGSSSVETEPAPAGFWNFKRAAIGLGVALPLYWIILAVTYEPVKTPSSDTSEVRLPGWYTAVQRMCRACEGRGAVEDSCRTCGRMGTITTRSGFVTTCPSCGGKGSVVHTCSTCRGSGRNDR